MKEIQSCQTTGNAAYENGNLIREIQNSVSLDEHLTTVYIVRYYVFAGCHSPDCDGAKELQLYSKRILVIGMDVASDNSMKAARARIEGQLGEKGEIEE